MTRVMERNIDRPEILVEGLIHMSAKTIIIGGSKAFKTWSFLDLAVSIATGTDWWGHPTRLGRVLYINFEIHDIFFRDRFVEVCEAKGVDMVQASDNLDYLGLRGFAGDLMKLATRIAEYCREGGYDAVVIDPIYKGMGNRDENSAGDMADLMNVLDKISHETGVAIIFGHHFSKGNQSAKDMIDRGSGSSVFGRDPDTIITMTPHEEDDKFVVEFRLRNFPPQDRYVVKRVHPLMVRDREADPEMIRTTGPGGRRAGAGRPPEYGDTEFLALLDDQPLSRVAWRAAAQAQFEGLSSSAFYRRVQEMTNDGLVVEENRVFRRTT